MTVEPNDVMGFIEAILDGQDVQIRDSDGEAMRFTLGDGEYNYWLVSPSDSPIPPTSSSRRTARRVDGIREDDVYEYIAGALANGCQVDVTARETQAAQVHP